MPRSASPVPEEISEEPNEKDITQSELQPGKDSTSSNTVVPTPENHNQPRLRGKWKAMLHREPVDGEEDSKMKPKEQFTFMSQLRATL